MFYGVTKKYISYFWRCVDAGGNVAPNLILVLSLVDDKFIDRVRERGELGFETSSLYSTSERTVKNVSALSALNILEYKSKQILSSFDKKSIAVKASVYDVMYDWLEGLLRLGLIENDMASSVKLVFRDQSTR